MPVVKFADENQNLEMCYELHGTGKTKIIFIMGLLTDGNGWMCQVSSIIISSLIQIYVQSGFFAQQSEYQVRIDYEHSIPSLTLSLSSVLLMIIVVVVVHHLH